MGSAAETVNLESDLSNAAVRLSAATREKLRQHKEAFEPLNLDRDLSKAAARLSAAIHETVGQHKEAFERWELLVRTKVLSESLLKDEEARPLPPLPPAPPQPPLKAQSPAPQVC